MNNSPQTTTSDHVRYVDKYGCIRWGDKVFDLSHIHGIGPGSRVLVIDHPTDAPAIRVSVTGITGVIATHTVEPMRFNDFSFARAAEPASARTANADAQTTTSGGRHASTQPRN